MKDVRCATCSTLNRLRPSGPTQIPVCGRCGAKLHTAGLNRWSGAQALARKAVAPASLGLLLFSAGCLVSALSRMSGGSELPSPSRSAGVPPPPILELLQPAELPSGFERVPAQPFVHNTSNVFVTDERVAPFKIVTSPGENYFVKLFRNSDNKLYAQFLIIGGNGFTTRVATGSYTMRYAIGQIWYGYKLKFGPGSATSYKRADKTLNFTEFDGGTKGVSVELVRQRGGNLPTTYITEQEFGP